MWEADNWGLVQLLRIYGPLPKWIATEAGPCRRAFPERFLALLVTLAVAAWLRWSSSRLLKKIEDGTCQHVFVLKNCCIE